MKNQTLFSVTFKDDSHFVGGMDYSETRWTDIPDKQIKRIFYRLPDGNYLALHGYEKYYHMIEAVMDVTGKEKGITKVQYAYIMGRTKDNVTSYRITLFNIPGHKYTLGDIVRRDFDKNHEKIKNLNPQGWK